MGCSIVFSDHKVLIPKLFLAFCTAAARADKTKPQIGINTLFLSRATDQLDTGTVPHVANLGKTSDFLPFFAAQK